MKTFAEYCQWMEGLWLADKNAVPGISKIMPPTPPKKTGPKPPPKLKTFHAPKTCESLDQLHRNVADLDKLGIGLLPPKKDDLQRLIDKQKNQITIPQRTQARPLGVPAKAPGSPLDRPTAAGTAWGASWPWTPCSLAWAAWKRPRPRAEAGAVVASDFESSINGPPVAAGGGPAPLRWPGPSGPPWCRHPAM